MLKLHIEYIGIFLLRAAFGLFILTAESAQAVGSFNVTVNIQSAAAQSNASSGQLVSSSNSVATVDGASQSTNNYMQVFSANSMQFAVGSKASDGSWLLGDMGIRRGLDVMTYWHMVNIPGNGDDPDRSYLEMLIGW